MQNSPDALVLFSGGLDSLLAARLLMEQGLNVLCLHFVSPFFGSPGKVPKWQSLYGLNIRVCDATAPFTQMLAGRPAHGTGKTLNPCVDCKITLLRLAKQLLRETGAKFLASGEVLGQRPMSQRPDALNIITREAGVAGLLLRPLCARLLPPTLAETEGIVDREKLLRISGRNRNEQLNMAAKMGISEIPSPGGGCKLTERENARRYWPLLAAYWRDPNPEGIGELARNFRKVNLGRILFKNGDARQGMLCIGRNKKDNEAIANAADSEDLLLRLPFPGPLALAPHGAAWPEAKIAEACATLASFSPEARELNMSVKMRAANEKMSREYVVMPERQAESWFLPTWEAVHEEICLDRKANLALTGKKC